MLGAAPGSLFFPCDVTDTELWACWVEGAWRAPEGRRTPGPWICGSGAEGGAGLGTRLRWVRMGTAPILCSASSSVMAVYPGEGAGFAEQGSVV